MTDTPTTFRRAPHAPWREILARRWSGRRSYALVLKSMDGLYHLSWPGHAPQEHGAASEGDPYDTYAAGGGVAALRETPPVPRLRHAYESAFHVDVLENHGTRAVRIPQQYGPPEPVTLQVVWWVHDPVEVVRTQTMYGWTAVRRDLDERLLDLKQTYAGERALAASEVAHHLGVPRALDHCGITYQVSDTFSREADDELLLSGGGADTFPYTWTANRREEYDFCLQAVRSGPVALAALWLLRQPDQVRDVLDWSVDHKDLVRQESNWQDQMAQLLTELSREERQELSEVLRERLRSLGRDVPLQKGTDRWSG